MRESENDCPETWLERYTLRQAANMLREHAGERVEPMVEKLVQAVRSGELAFYEPGKNALYRPEVVRDWYGHAFWDDLNGWLDQNEKRVTWRFPKPDVTADDEEPGQKVSEGPDDVVLALPEIDVIYNNHVIDWESWVQKRLTLNAGQAARLSQGLDPHVFVTLTERPNSHDPERRCGNARLIEGLATDAGINKATPQDWLVWIGTNTPYPISTRFRKAVEERAERENNLAWWDVTLDAGLWWRRKDVKPRDAAMLLCRLNPLRDSDPEETITDETTPDDFRRLQLVFDDYAGTSPGLRTVRDWLEIARDENLKHHSWIDEWAKGMEPMTNDGDSPSAPVRKGKSKADLLAADWILTGPFTLESLDRALSDVPAWLETARIFRGSPGKSSSLWNPAIVASCLLDRQYATSASLTKTLQRYFPEWVEEWQCHLEAQQ